MKQQTTLERDACVPPKFCSTAPANYKRRVNTLGIPVRDRGLEQAWKARYIGEANKKARRDDLIAAMQDLYESTRSTALNRTSLPPTTPTTYFAELVLHCDSESIEIDCDSLEQAKSVYSAELADALKGNQPQTAMVRYGFKRGLETQTIAASVF